MNAKTALGIIKHMEWSSWVAIDGERYSACPCCGGIDPECASALAKSYPTGHLQGCSFQKLVEYMEGLRDGEAPLTKSGFDEWGEGIVVRLETIQRAIESRVTGDEGSGGGAMDLTTVAREMFELEKELQEHSKSSMLKSDRLRDEIEKRRAILEMHEKGIDAEKVLLAKTVISVTDYSRGGRDRESVVRDALEQFAAGAPVSRSLNLWNTFFGTKDYDRWSGQRCDCSYGYGPRHGRIVFSVGLTDEARKRKQCELTKEEVEAVIYYLMNLERIQASTGD